MYMNKTLLTTSIVFLMVLQATSQLVITEIMYNPPESGTDSLEFIEIKNVSSEAVDLTGYHFDGIRDTLDGEMIAPGQYFVTSVNARAFESIYGFMPDREWGDGALSNGGEFLAIMDAQGMVIDSVRYDDGGDWPGSADGTDGQGASIALCDETSDNNLGENWGVSKTGIGVIIEDNEIKATPGAASASDLCEDVMVDYPRMTIAEVTGIDANGVANSSGTICELVGTIHGINFRPSGLQFFIIDDSGDGIAVFNENENLGYTFQEGDEVAIRGTISQFRGLIQMLIVEIDMLSANNALRIPREVTILDESTESDFVTLTNLSFVDPSQWLTDGSSFNVEMTDGSSTLSIRIDSDTEIAGTPIPTGPIKVTGLGSQFDLDEPYDSGYQLLPRYLSDIVEISNTTSEALDLVKVYPNPVTNMLSIESENLVEQVLLSDLQGKQVLISYGNKIDISSIPNGLYFITIQIKGEIVTKKIQKI